MAAVSSDCVDDFDKLVVGEVVPELFVEVSQVVEVEDALALDVQKVDGGSSSIVVEWMSLRLMKTVRFFRRALRRTVRS